MAFRAKKQYDNKFVFLKFWADSDFGYILKSQIYENILSNKKKIYYIYMMRLES